MKENFIKMLYIDSLRKKLGISPKKCIYIIEKGEIIISKIKEKEICIA